MNYYIFNADVSELFYNRLDELHDKYVYHLLLNGLASEGQDLESIKMTKSPNVNEKYCQRVIGGLVNLKPQVIVKLIEDKKTKLECVFTMLNDNEYVKYELFMIQNVMNWPEIGKYSCQVWYLGDTSVNQINEHWE